jgi:hypothetical protein
VAACSNGGAVEPPAQPAYGVIGFYDGSSSVPDEGGSLPAYGVFGPVDGAADVAGDAAADAPPATGEGGALDSATEGAHDDGASDDGLGDAAPEG